MRNIKAKLTALLMAACCCLACIGIGVSFNKANNVVANAATTEELTAEFTNNGQFTVGNFREDMPFEIVESTAEGVPEGAEGAVLKITGVADGTNTAGAFATLDFTASKILRSGANIIIRVYQPDTKSFRTSKAAGSAEWTAGYSAPPAGWSEVTVSGATHTGEDHQIMTTMSMGFRHGAECYIDSVTVVDNDLKKDFTNDGQFDVKQYSTNRTYFVDGSTEGLPEGYEGAVLKLYSGATQYVDLDFSGSGLKASDVASMSAKCYLPNAYADGTYTDSNYEFRLGNIENTAGGAGANDMSAWFDAPINVAKIATDENGYLTTVTIGLRNKGNTASYFYIDSITVTEAQYNVVQVGAVEVYGANATHATRLYLMPTDQTVTWHDASANFTWHSGLGFEQVRGGEVIQSGHLTLANRNTNAASASNIKHFYLDINSYTREAGDIFRFGGTYYNVDLGLKYVIEDCEVLWDGTSFGKNAEYTTLDMGKLTVRSNVSSASRIYGTPANYTLANMPHKSWNDAFYLYSGDGMKINGESTDITAMHSTGEGVTFTFPQVTEAGTVLSISGTFRCPVQKLEYTIEESKFVWNGSKWEAYVEYTTYNVGDVKFYQVGASGKHIYFSPVSTANFDTTTWSSGWDAQFSWKDGVGVTINGETVSNAKVKFPGSFFIEFATAPQVGDILCVGGTYYNASVAKEYKINEAAFKYNGTAWETVIDEPEVQYTITELGTLKVHGHSASTTTNIPSAKALYMKSTTTLPFTTWDDKFNLESGDGFKLNGNNVTTGQLVSADKNLYVNLANANVQVGDVLSVSGTFVHVTELAKYVIEESKFIWTGLVWENYIEPTTYNIGKVAIDADSSATAVNFKKANGEQFEVKDGSWATKMRFITGTGVGVTLNGTQIENASGTAKFKMNDIKLPNNMYVGLGTTAVVGDILVVGGTFYFNNGTVAANYVIEESKFIYNGTAWEIDYDTYTVTKVGMAGNSTASVLQLYSLEGDELPKDKGDWDNVYSYGDGASVKLNDEAITAEIKMPGDLYVPLGKDAQVGDCFTINGTFYNEAKAIKLVFDNCQLYWNGTAWVDSYEPPVVEYAITELGTLKVQGNSDSTTTNIPKATELYMKSTTTLPFTTWDDKFNLESGDGFKLNGNNVTTGQLVSADKNLYVNLANANVQVGDVLSVSGTFVHVTALAKYVIEESKFIWTGLVWENYLQPTNYEIGKVAIDGGSSATAVNFKKANGTAFEVKDGSWATKMRFITGTGVGVTLNGTQIENALGTAKFKMNDIKLPNNMYVGLGTTAVVGDILVVGGTFYFNNGTDAANYVIEESTFTWNGTAWEKVINYSTIELGTLTFDKVESENKFVYLNPTSGEIPSDPAWKVYTCIDGAGVKMNDVAVGATVKFPSQCFIEFASAPNLGDKLTISGTFANVETALKFVISETTLYWDGTAWVTEEPVVYTVHELGVLQFQKVGGENKFVYLEREDGVAIPNSDWAAFTLESGAGVKINDANVDAVVKFPGTVFIEFASAPAQGDKLTIGGTFYNEELLVKYIVPETTLYWDTMEWVEVDSSAYEVHDLGEMLVANPSATVEGGARATQLYLKKADGTALPFPDSSWNTEFAYQSGMGVCLNGEWITIIDLESTNSGLWLKLENAGVKVGDVLTIGGTYKSADVSAKYVITESSFMWNGTFWVNYVTNDKLEAYDIVTIQDIGLGEELTMEGTVSKVQNDFVPSASNTTNSVAVRFGYNCADTALAGSSLRFRLRGSNWEGITFDLRSGKIYIQHLESTQKYSLESNTDYVIEIGAISMKDGRVWTYVKLDEVMVLSTMMTSAQFTPTYFPSFGGEFTSHVSIYATEIAKTTITDPDGIKMTYVSSAGTHTEKVKKNETYALATGKTTKTFIGWAYDGVLYAPGTEITVDKAMTFTAVEIDFTMEEGAAMRIGETADKSGIRFTSMFNKAEFDALIGQYGIESIDYGTLIIPYDYLGAGQKPNLINFVDGQTILKIESTVPSAEDLSNFISGDYFKFRGAMQTIKEDNYGRLFAGRAYMEITFAGGEVWTVYTAFNSEDNVRSIRMIAKAFKADTSEPQNENEPRYNDLTAEKRAIVDAYIGTEEIKLMNYNAYNANAMSIIAWNFPALDPTNNYYNDANIAVANTMKAAGIQVIGLTGANILSMNTVVNIEKTRQIIDFFWSQGIGTFAFQNNGNNSLNNNFAQAGYPDFSDCEGFMGFLAWDEPSLASIDKIAEQVAAFEAAYAGTDTIFMGNLLPSYASTFGGETPDKAAFKAYLQKYCDVVLSKVSGTKWLSLDTYPILADKTLVKNFLFDLGVLKTTALKNDAHAHVILQSYGFIESGNSSKERMPSEAELRMQAYAAMAFGVDSMSWYVYSPNGHGECDTAVDVNGNIVKQENYNAFKNINAELTAIGKVYNAFNWKGIILGAGKDNGVAIGSWEISKDNDYKAFEMVMGQLGAYELSASNTKHLSSVKTNKADWNYLMGVMEDKNGNEGYVLCNYNSHEKNRAQTITLTFDSNVTEVVIYRGGVAQTVSVNNKTLTVDLATGEGVIILPSKIN